jgi:Ras-related GTP-binding protein C/D
VLEKRETKLAVTKVRNTDFVHLDIWDWPGESGAVNLRENVDAVVYVIDAQEDLRKVMIIDICHTFATAKSLNENVILEVFVNKVDGDHFASEELRVEVQQAFQSQISQELSDKEKWDFSIHLTSVYNPSILEAWSLVIQKLIPNQSVIVELLDSLVEACKMEKAFLFDAQTRLYLATDHNPVDHQTLTLCADSIDLALGFQSVYGNSAEESFSKDHATSVKVKLSNNMVLYSKQVGKWLALVCVSRRESWVDPWMVERNVVLFKDALEEVQKENDRDQVGEVG